MSEFEDVIDKIVTTPRGWRIRRVFRQEGDIDWWTGTAEWHEPAPRSLDDIFGSPDYLYVAHAETEELVRAKLQDSIDRDPFRAE